MSSTVQRFKLSETEVTRQHTDFLRAHGWLLLRLQSGIFQRPHSSERVVVGEKGMADWLALRCRDGVQQIFFLEIKKEGGKLSPEQGAWLDNMNSRGVTATWSNDIGGFARWYKLHFGER